MSIRIEINNQYVITSDRYQFILQEKKTATSGKNEGKEWWVTTRQFLSSFPVLSCMTF